MPRQTWNTSAQPRDGDWWPSTPEGYQRYEERIRNQIGDLDLSAPASSEDVEFGTLASGSRESTPRATPQVQEPSRDVPTAPAEPRPQTRFGRRVPAPRPPRTPQRSGESRRSAIASAARQRARENGPSASRSAPPPTAPAPQNASEAREQPAPMSLPPASAFIDTADQGERARQQPAPMSLPPASAFIDTADQGERARVNAAWLSSNGARQGVAADDQSGRPDRSQRYEPQYSQARERSQSRTAMR
jgi:hypothetical protein